MVEVVDLVGLRPYAPTFPLVARMLAAAVREPPPGAPQVRAADVGYLRLAQRRSEPLEGRREVPWPSVRWLPRGLRRPALSRLGVLEFDVGATHPTIMVAMVFGGRAFSRLVAFAAGGAARSELRDRIARHYGPRREAHGLRRLSRDQVKALLLSIPLGGGFAGWHRRTGNPWPPVLPEAPDAVAFQAEVGMASRRLLAAYPAFLARAQGREPRSPRWRQEASACAKLLQTVEDNVVAVLEAALGARGWQVCTVAGDAVLALPPCHLGTGDTSVDDVDQAARACEARVAQCLGLEIRVAVKPFAPALTPPWVRSGWGAGGGGSLHCGDGPWAASGDPGRGAPGRTPVAAWRPGRVCSPPGCGRLRVVPVGAGPRGGRGSAGAWQAPVGGRGPSRLATPGRRGRPQSRPRRARRMAP